MTGNTAGLDKARTPWRLTTTAFLCCAPLVAAPLSASAQESRRAEGEEPFRLAPLIVNAQASAGDDSSTVVAQELWVGGKVPTSILDTPASVSVVTEKEIAQRSASTTEEVLQYTPGVITDYYGTDDRNDYSRSAVFRPPPTATV